ncbi:MAG: sodium:solute symporter [Firmicutes bacterium HGW-Firmicutes-15]|nr:MAG: sodium:solute symporter [Firmicutes bacterium HGW-Firmicutes-15]
MIFTLGAAAALLPTLNNGHYIGIAITIAIMIGTGLYAGSQVKSSADYSGGSRKAGPALVTGTIMGTLVGGASTIGTAQLAFQFGWCAWWFTLGAGLGCAVLGWGMLKPLYTSNKETIPQFLVGTYGNSIGPLTSVSSAIGMFFSVMSQGISAVALITSVFHISPLLAVFVGFALVLTYVLAGGLLGTGMSGVAKLILLYLTVIVTGVLAFAMFGGNSGVHQAFPAKYPWYSLVARGFSKDVAAGVSLLIGVISTQTYIQAVLSAKSLGAARKGALYSAFLIPPIGVGGIYVGLFMKANIALFPGLTSAQVLPTFVMTYLPGWVAGMIMAILLIATIGTWAGLSLGIATMMTRDIYQRFINPKADSKKTLLMQRVFIVAVGLLAVYFVSGNAGGLILGFSFLSMGLRGCTIVLPLMGALFFHKFVTPAGGMAAAVCGPLANIYWALVYPKGMDPLYPGILAAFIAIVIVSLVTKKPEVSV